MTIQDYLAEQGLSSEEIAAITGNEKAAKAMSAALSRYEEGATLMSRAQAQQAETSSFWEQKTKELEGSVGRLTAAERRAAAAEAEAARVKAYNKTLAEQGYDVPKEMYEGNVVAKPAEPQYMTREEAMKMARGTAPDLISLTKLNNEYRSLYGDEYLSIDQDFEEAQRLGKPLTEYARSKYNFDGKRAEKAAAADQKRIDEIVNEKMKARESELAAKYGSNHEMRSPLPSKFDRLQGREGFKKESWKSQEGRDQSRADRLKKFENISIN